MAHKTTVTLPDDLHAQWKAAGLPLAEIIRRGLEGSGDTARHAAAETRLAGVEHRLAQLETRSITFPTADFTAVPARDTDDAETDEEHRERWEREDRERRDQGARRDHAKLRDAYGAAPLDAFDAAQCLGLGKVTAYDHLNGLVARGLADMTPKGPGQRRDLYTMRATEETSTDAVPVE